MNMKKAVSGVPILVITILVVIGMIITKHYTGIPVVVIFGGIAASLASKEREKSMKDHPEMYKEDLAREEARKSTKKSTNWWKWGMITIGIPALLLIIAGIAMQINDSNSSTTSTPLTPSTTSTTSAVKSSLLNFDDKQGNVAKLAVYLNNDVQPDVAAGQLNTNYVSAKCTAIGEIVTQLNAAADKGMVNLNSNNVAFVGKMMKEQNLMTPTDYGMGANILSHMQGILLETGEPSAIGNSYALGCAFGGGYVKAYKVIHPTAAVPTADNIQKDSKGNAWTVTSVDGVSNGSVTLVSPSKKVTITLNKDCTATAVVNGDQGMKLYNGKWGMNTNSDGWSLDLGNEGVVSFPQDAPLTAACIHITHPH